MSRLRKPSRSPRARCHALGGVGLVLLTTALTGCLGGSEPVAPESALPDVVGSLPAVTFPNPQTASHPAFGWPTLNDPVQGLEADAMPAYWGPIEARELPAQITGMALGAASEAPFTTAGIAIFGSLLAAPGLGGDAVNRLFDISDPLAPVLLSEFEGEPGRDADFIAYPDGRLVLVMATNGGVVPVWDVTDPTYPVFLTNIEPPTGSHNVLVVPGTPILYNANSRGGGGSPEDRLPETGTGQTEIYDLTDPANPVEVQVWRNGFGCHDITAYVDAPSEKHRAYCAGFEFTQIWDIADPLNPSVITNIPAPHGIPGTPSANVGLALWSHLATVNHDASVLIVGDETGGGGLAACDGYVDAGLATLSGPLGNLWFYDITDERNPVLRSWLSPDPPAVANNPLTGGQGGSNCTAHFGRIIEDRDVIPVAFYSAGTVLVDFRDIGHPVILDQFMDGTNTWDAWYYQGYVFTGDMARGVDVLLLE